MKSGFVDDGGQVSARESWRGFGHAHQIDVGPELHFAAVDLENFQAAFDIGQRDVNLAIESAGTSEGWIEHVDAVGGGADDDLIVGIKTIHLDENGVEGLFAFIMPAR